MTAAGEGKSTAASPPEVGTAQTPRGLDFADLDRITPDELAAFQEHYVKLHGRRHVGFDFFAQKNPSALKRYRLFATYAAVPFDRWLILTATNFANITWYAHLGYEDGIRYIVHIQQTSGGSSREEVWEGLGITLLLGGPQSSEVIATALQDYEWLEAPTADTATWSVNRHLLSSGLDFTDPHMSSGELERLEEWYVRALGEVPAYVRFLAKHRPEALKAYRNRYEHTVWTLPVALLPLASIKLNMYRCNAELLRENVLLARHLGVSKEDVMSTAVSGLLYGGMEAASMLERAAGDVFDSWNSDNQ